MAKYIFLFCVFLQGCTAGRVMKVDTDEFNIAYLDLLRPTVPGVRVKPNFKWANSQYLKSSALERTSVLKRVATQAAQNYCEKKGTKAELGTMSVLGEAYLETQEEQKPTGLDADFKCVSR